MIRWLRSDSLEPPHVDNENRHRYDRSKLRYPGDLTDAEWSLIEGLIPPAKRGGNKRSVVMREVVNGLMYVLSTGCQWRSCRRTCRRAAPSIGILAAGPATGRSDASIMHST